MAKQRSVNYPHRGDVFLVRFDPAEGSEIKKTRPALIIQNDLGNKYGATTIVAAITSKFDESLYPTEVLIKAPEGGLTCDSVVRLDHMRSIDKKRLVKHMGKLKPKTLEKINQSIKISLGLIDL